MDQHLSYYIYLYLEGMTIPKSYKSNSYVDVNYRGTR